jgi:hypothetical protein
MEVIRAFAARFAWRASSRSRPAAKCNMEVGTGVQFGEGRTSERRVDATMPICPALSVSTTFMMTVLAVKRDRQSTR